MGLRNSKIVETRAGNYDILNFNLSVPSQGLLKYLAANVPKLVWTSFGSWLRTIRPGIAPSELVVATALRHSLPEFLLSNAQHSIFAKFIVDRQDPDRLDVFRMAS